MVGREARIRRAARKKEAAEREWRAAILNDGEDFTDRFLASLAGTSYMTIWRIREKAKEGDHAAKPSDPPSLVKHDAIRREDD